MPLSSRQKSLRASIAANARWVNTPTEERAAGTAAARAALEKRFEDEVDVDRVLSPEERSKRVKNARALYYKRLQFESSKARRRSS